MSGKQAVIETTAGRIVLDLLPEQAPNHVGYFIKLAQEGAYNGTTFHRLIRHASSRRRPAVEDPPGPRNTETAGSKMLAFEPGAGQPRARSRLVGARARQTADSAGSSSSSA